MHESINNELTMSELLQSVRREYYHDVIGVRDAESRLEGKQDSYLLRESDIKAGLFIISHVKSTSVSHILVPNSDGKFLRQSLEDAVEIAAVIIASSDNFQHPVPPPDQSRDTSSASDNDGHRSSDNNNNNNNNESRCYCCSFRIEDKKTLDSHLKLHKIIRCPQCSKWFKPSSYSTHKRHCISNDKHSCALCGYETIHAQSIKNHRRMHVMKPFLCRVENCKSCFETEDLLREHLKLHEDGFIKCDHCEKKFRRPYQRTRHVIRVHQSLRRRSTIGFGLFQMAGVIQQRKKGRTMMTCREEGCNFQTRAYQTQRMAIHVASKHPSCPRPKKPHVCKECKKAFAYPYLLHKHEQSCKLVKVKSKRIVPMVMNRSLISIKKKYANVPVKTFCNIMRDFSKANPHVIFEGDLQKALQESLNELKKHFHADFLNLIDKNGLEVATVVVLIKDLHYIIRQYIARNHVTSPRVALSQDGGNEKYIVGLSIFNMDKLGVDICGYSSGGRRKTLVIAASNRCKELRANMDAVLGPLCLVKLEYRTILPSDLKAANLLMGIGPHTSLCPCLFCEATKIDDDTGRPTTDKALHWSEARRRTMRIISELRQRFLAKWGARANTPAAKAAIKKFFSVVNFPIELPEAMMDMLVLMVIPPDPLHVCLLVSFIKYKF